MAANRNSGKKRTPFDTAAAAINQGNTNKTDLAAHEADLDNPHDTSLENLIDTEIGISPALLEGQGIWYDADTGLWKNRVSITESWPTGLANGGELNIGPGANDIEVITGIGAVLNSYTNPLSPPVAKALSWDQINEPITAAPSVAGSVVWFAIQDTGVPAVPAEFGGIFNFVGELVQYPTPPGPTLAKQNIFLGVAVHNGIEWKEISNPKVINQSAETLRELVITVLGPSFIIEGGNVTESGTFSVDQAAGVIWENNRNWHVDKSDPNREALPAAAPVSFQYVNQDFGSVGAPVTVVDPTMYDDGSPAPVPVPLPANNTTIQKLYLDPANNYWMLWGQIVYPTFFAAEASIPADLSNSVIPFILQRSILLGYVITERQKTQWDIDEAIFIPAVGGNGQAGGGGTPITTFINLTDTPASYNLQAQLVPRVNLAENALEFVPYEHLLYGEDSGVTAHKDIDTTEIPVVGTGLVWTGVDPAKPWEALNVWVAAGYGGIRQLAPAVLPDLGAGWTILLADAISITTPRGVTQDIATESLAFNTAGVWSVVLGFSIAHNELNLSRTIDVRLFNITDGSPGTSSTIGVGRNVGVTTYSVTLLIEILTADLGDAWRVEISGGADTFTTVVENSYTFTGTLVSEFRG